MRIIGPCGMAANDPSPDAAARIWRWGPGRRWRGFHWLGWRPQRPWHGAVLWRRP